MDRLQAMRVFVQVIDEGSFAAAARRLNLSPAAVTRQVADLEDQLGVRLIQRTTRRLALTDTGERYLERVRLILADVDDAEALATSASSEPRGMVRLLMPPALAVHLIAPLLPDFRARCPKVSIDITAPGPVVTVDENYDISLLLTTERLVEGDFVARLLARVNWVLCASPAYLASHGEPLHPNDMDHHQVIAPYTLREVTFRAPDQSLVKLAVQRMALSTSHIDTQCSAAVAGLGIAGVPSFLAHKALQSGLLRRVLPHWRLFAGSLYAAMPTRKHLPARTRAFLDCLVAHFGGEDRDPWLID